MAAIWPIYKVKIYEKIAALCGAKFSKGKHYVSDTYGVFTEEIFKVK